MKAIRFTEYKDAVGQGYIQMKVHNFPSQGWCRKTVGNVIYIFAKPCVALVKLSELEVKSGKQIKLCIVPNAIIKGLRL